MPVYCYKLKFSSALHLGTEGIGQEKIEPMLHSDTLYNAIIINWSLLFDDEIEGLVKEPLFNISSAFPFIQDVLFFPAPIGIFDNKMEDKKEEVKFWKKIEWIPEKILRSYLKKGTLEDNDYNSLKDYFENPEYYLKSKLNYGKEEERPKVSVDSFNSASTEYFHSRDFVFKNNSGLFFLVEFTDNSIRNKFDSALSLLGDNGIGADRSIGKGLFSYSSTTINFEKSENNDKGLLLSLYFPQKEEIEKDLLLYSSYKLKERFGHIGWIKAGSKRRNKVRMLAEGSVLSNEGRKGGTIVKVASTETGVPYNVFRNGIGFLLKIGGKSNE